MRLTSSFCLASCIAAGSCDVSAAVVQEVAMLGGDLGWSVESRGAEGDGGVEGGQGSLRRSERVKGKGAQV